MGAVITPGNADDSSSLAPFKCTLDAGLLVVRAQKSRIKLAYTVWWWTRTAGVGVGGVG